MIYDMVAGFLFVRRATTGTPTVPQNAHDRRSGLVARPLGRQVALRAIMRRVTARKGWMKKGIKSRGLRRPPKCERADDWLIRQLK